MNLEIIFHGCELVILLFGIAWPMVRTSNRIMDIMKDFPPHRHEGMSVLYPKGFEPSKIQKLKGDEK